MASVTFSHWQPTRQRRDRRVFRVPTPIRVALKVFFAAAALAVCGEVAIRGFEYFSEQPLGSGSAVAAYGLPSGATLGGRTVNSLGYVDDEFVAQASPGKVRIALLGGRATLAGDEATDMATRLEQCLPNVEIDHFGLPEGNPGRYSAQLRSDVLRFRPHWVLLCLSPADDVAATSEPRGAFDVRLLELTSRWVGLQPAVATPAHSLQRLTESLDYETYVRRRTAPAAVCKSGDDASLDGRWQAAQTNLRRMAERCREHDIGFAVVFAPSEFQLNPTLAEALRRRAGVDAARFDVELPQRRWTALTEHLQLPSLDLLPTFRSADAVLYEASSPDWNDEGRKLAAETTARWLQGRLTQNLAATP